MEGLQKLFFLFIFIYLFCFGYVHRNLADYPLYVRRIFERSTFQHQIQKSRLVFLVFSQEITSLLVCEREGQNSFFIKDVS